jgi:hypothetical protein
MKFGVKVMPKVLSFLETAATILAQETLGLRGGLDSGVTGRYKYEKVPQVVYNCRYDDHY